MMVSEAAYQRKNRVLADPAKRLNSLSKTEFEDDEEPKEPPTSFLNEMMLPSTQSKAKVVKPAERKISPLDVKGTQRIAIFNLLSYIASMILGTYVCHIIHGHAVDRYCPSALRFIFSMLDAFGPGHFVRTAVSAWHGTSDPMRVTVAKVLTYSSLLVSLYPMWSSMKKTAESTEEVEDSQAAPEEPAASEDSGSSGFLADLDEEHLTMIVALVLRSSAACLVFGLLGYDALYNAHFLVRYLA